MVWLIPFEIKKREGGFYFSSLKIYPEQDVKVTHKSKADLKNQLFFQNWGKVSTLVHMEQNDTIFPRNLIRNFSKRD